MSDYRRIKLEGGLYFFTVVTYKRLPILTTEPSRRILHFVWEETKQRYPFETIAICLLPDHLHCIWKLPEDDANYSFRWQMIKSLFTKRYLKEIGSGEERNESRVKRGEAAIWQRRFWEHTITEQMDFEIHMDYVHYNPIKHGYVKRAADWPWSSFMRYLKSGVYDAEWAGVEEDRLATHDWE